jgi:hypothetical protein
LNDAINAFSTDILYFIRQSKAKVYITEPFDTVFNMITQKINSEQIISLCLNTDEVRLRMIFSFLPMFNQVISLTLLNLHFLEQISEYGIYFPKLTCLSLRYNTEIGFNILKNIFHYLPNSIRRFEIHCTGALCTHYDEDQFNIHYQNFSVKYFLLDMNQYPLISTNECFQHHKSCFFMTTIDLMKYMINIRYFYLIINQYDVEKLLDINDWKYLAHHCYYLRKVILQILGNILEDKLLSQKVLEIQNALIHVGQTMIEFQIIFA